MRWIRGAGRAAGAVFWCIVLLPVLALGPAAVLDRGPAGEVRATPFPAALALLDPYTWLCARNSLAVAIVVTLGSALVGIAAARVATGRRFWGRPILAALAAAGLALPPSFAAIGLAPLFNNLSLTDRDTWPIDPAWLGWAWAALGWNSALVGLATAAALRRVDPAWNDAARLAGATRGQTWRHLIAPVVRPDVARALALVFGLTLLDPGPALVLGLRRTLAFQIVASAWSFHEPGRAGRVVVLTLVGIALAWAGREVIRHWGGPPALVDDPIDRPPPEARPETAGILAGLGLAAPLALAALIIWGPCLLLVGAAFEVWFVPRLHGSAAAFAGLASDPLMRQYARNAARLGLAVVVVEVVLARLAMALIGASRGRLAWLVTWPGVVPPLAVGVGVLVLPAVLGMLADVLGPTAASRGLGLAHGLADALRSLAALLDPDQTPGVALVLGVAVARLPLAARAALERRYRLRPTVVDAAVVLGASHGRARRKLSGRWLLGVSPAAGLLTLVVAATHPTPALVLAPTAETRPVGPAAVALVRSHPDASRAAALATLIVAVNLAALGLAAPGRGGLERSWLRLG